MIRTTFALSFAFFIAAGYFLLEDRSQISNHSQIDNIADTLRNASRWPSELSVTNFASADLTPSPACLAVAATGEVFVGVDQIGSLGKTPGKGSIVRLVDSDNDGKVDAHTQFAM